MSISRFIVFIPDTVPGDKKRSIKYKICNAL